MSKQELFNATVTFVICGIHLIIIKIITVITPEPEPFVYIYLFWMIVWSYAQVIEGLK